MPVGRFSSHESEAVSSRAIPLRYSIDWGLPVVTASRVHEGRFGNAPEVGRSRLAGECLRAFLFCALTLAPSAGFAEELNSAATPTPPATPQAFPIGPPDPEGSKQSPSWEMRTGRSYLIPAFEILAYGFLLNLYDRHYTEPKDEYRTTGNTIRTHLTDSRWVLDRDQFSVNQFLHPYGGTVYFGLARSAGLNFWESWLYAGAGSFLWEIAGEKTLPSINDQITTTFGGTFLGEPLFRMANLLLESGDGGKPGFWRELAAAVISPPTGFNRLAFGNRFDEVYPSHNPATFLRLQVGGTQ
ncbi:MAG: DUF3943 domain-containing protein, partial [Nitrospiraceae bacterium]